MWRTAAVASVTLGCAACAGQGTLKRWDAVSGLPPSAPPVLSVSSAPAQPSDPLTVRALPERAAAAYISALSSGEKDAEKLRAALAESIAKRSSGVDDRSKISRVLIISVQRPGIRPGDRLIFTRVDVRPIDFRFTDYQMASTQYATIDIGSVSITTQDTASLGLQPELGGTIIGTGNASVGVTRTGSATRKITERPQASVHVGPEEATILQTGGEGTDLTGNTLVKLALQLPEGEQSSYAIARPELRDAKGVIKKPKDASVKLKRLIAVHPKDLYVCARLAYQDRRIVGAPEFHDEGRQKVSIVSDQTGWMPFVVVPREELDPPLWIIETGNAALQLDTGLGVMTLVFDDYDAAEDFVAWIKRYSATNVGGQALGTGTIGSRLIKLARFGDLSVSRFKRTPAVAGKQSCPA